MPTTKNQSHCCETARAVLLNFRWTWRRRVVAAAVQLWLKYQCEIIVLGRQSVASRLIPTSGAPISLSAPLRHFICVKSAFQRLA